MVITSLYGMEFKPDVKTQRNYERKRQAAIELLGKKYLLAEPLTKKEQINEKAIAGNSKFDVMHYVRS